MSKNVVSVTDGNFDQEVIESSHHTLILVDFWAEWCGPCQQLSPTIEALSVEYLGKLKVCKLNVDENPKTSARFHVRGIPTIFFFKKGEKVKEWVGKHSKEMYIQEIQNLLE